MSGIAGVIHPQETAGIRSGLSRMSEALRHRGRTEKMLLVDGRIGVIAREHEHSAYGTALFESPEAVVAFDGNLWNQTALGRRLGTAGIANPAELCWLGFQRDNLDFFDCLSGSFAIVIYEKKADKVHLARDLFGHRPLYYACQDGSVWFASEQKCLLAGSDLEFAVNSAQIASSLAYGVTLGPETLIERVYKLIPGYVASGKPGCVLEQKLYFDPGRVAPRTDLRSMRDFADAIWQTLGENMTQQLNGCARNGLFLSSGIDSSLVALKLGQVCGTPGTAITCGYEDSPEQDESEVAESIAAECGIRFRNVVTGSSNDIFESFCAVIEQMENPTRFSIAIPIERSLREVNDDIQCLLTGDYADLFFGYDDHPFAVTHGRIKRMPSLMRRALRMALPVLRRMGATSSYAKRFEAADVDNLKDYTLLTWAANKDGMGLFREPDVHTLAPHIAELYPRVERMPVDVQWSLIAMMALIYCWNELFETLGSAAGLDVVNPFQSKSMLAIARAMPYEYKFAGGETKPVMRMLAAEKFSLKFAHLQKKIFASPLHDWMNHSKRLNQAIDDLSRPHSLIKDYLEPGVIDGLIARYREHGFGGRDGWRLAQLLFLLLGFEVWLATFPQAARLDNKSGHPTLLTL